MLKIDVMAALPNEVICFDPPTLYFGSEGVIKDVEEDYDDDVFEDPPEELIVKIPLDKIKLNKNVVH